MNFNIFSAPCVKKMVSFKGKPFLICFFAYSDSIYNFLILQLGNSTISSEWNKKLKTTVNNVIAHVLKTLTRDVTLVVSYVKNKNVFTFIKEIDFTLMSKITCTPLFCLWWPTKIEKLNLMYVWKFPNIF